MKIDKKQELIDISFELLHFNIEKESEKKRLIGLLNKLSDDDSDFWFDIGAVVAGPLYYALKSWIVDSIRDDRKLFFVSDSGSNMFQVFKNAGIDNIEYLDMARIQEDNRGLFSSDAYVFVCDWNGSIISHIDKMKRDASGNYEIYFLCPGILNSEDSIKNVHIKHYKTYFFDFYKDYGFQRAVRNNIDLFDILFSAPDDDNSKSCEDKTVFGRLYDNDSKHRLLEGILAYFEFVGGIDNAQTIKDAQQILISYLDRMSRSLMEETEYRKTEESLSESGKECQAENEFDQIKYCRWVRKHQKSEDEIKLQYRPKFSIVVPVCTEDEYLRETVDSILAQTYDDYEAILITDCSVQSGGISILKEYENNRHITLIYRQSGEHISTAANDGISVAKGDFLIFMDCDDMIAPNALYEIARKLNEDPKLDFIYTDEDKLTEDGKTRHKPFFKPDWSPDLLWNMNYTNHLSAFRMDIVKKTGGFRSQFGGAQDYDFVLRFMEFSDNSRVGHVSDILYHCRDRKKSGVPVMGSKYDISEVLKRVKEDALKRRNIAGHMEFISELSQYRVVYEPAGNPGVSIIIPSKDNYSILRQCIDSIKTFTTYSNYEIVVVDNGSSEKNRKLIEQYLAANDCTYVYDKFPFNFSRMCNIGAQKAKNKYFLFLNDDIEIFEEDWLDRLIGQAMQENVGAVGAKLFYPMSTIIQHAGAASIKAEPGHNFARKDDQYIYYFGLNRFDYNVSCVTGACLMIDKDIFDQVGGFDEDYAVAYNDVDLCFRVNELGYYIVMRQDVYAYHYESLSRGNDMEDDNKFFRLSGELQRLNRRHPWVRKGDPFINRNLRSYYGEEIDIRDNVDEISMLDDHGSVPNKHAYIDQILFGNEIRIYGWSFLPNRTDNADLERNVVFEDIYGYKLKAPVVNIKREDLVEAHGGRKDLLMCGFECIVDINYIRMDVIPYRLGIQMIDTEGISHIYWEDNYRPVMRNAIFRKRYCSVRELPDYIFHKPTCDIRYYIDFMGKCDDGLRFDGWAFCNGDNHYRYRTSLILEGVKGNVYECELPLKERSDVAVEIPEVKFICKTGFDASFSLSSFEKNMKYNVILRFTNVIMTDDVQDIRVGELVL